MTQTAKQLLEQLTEAYAHRDLLKIDHDQARDNAIPSEVEAALADIDIEFIPKIDAIVEKIAALEEQVKQAVLDAGETVKGGALQAVYSKPRVTWDSKQLDGLMIVIPELTQARKVGLPSVSIRKIGG